MPDAISLLNEHRPPATHEPDIVALERILSTPAVPRRRRSRRPRRVLAVAAAAAVVAVVATPLLNDSPDVLARAAVAFDDSDAILHFTATWHDSRAGAQGSVEVWRADGGRKERTLSASGESAEDSDARTGLYYDARRDQIRRVTQEEFARTHELPEGVAKGEPISISPRLTSADDFAALLDQARRGDATVQQLPDTTVRGVPVYQLKIEVEQPGTYAERIVSIDRETYLPVRIEVRLGGAELFTTDYTDVEQLPRTEANEALLRLAPHPGAKEVG